MDNGELDRNKETAIINASQAKSYQASASCYPSALPLFFPLHVPIQAAAPPPPPFGITRVMTPVCSELTGIPHSLVSSLQCSHPHSVPPVPALHSSASPPNPHHIPYPYHSNSHVAVPQTCSQKGKGASRSLSATQKPHSHPEYPSSSHTSARHRQKWTVFPRTNTRYTRMKLQVSSLDLSGNGFLENMARNRSCILDSCWERKIVPHVSPHQEPMTSPQLTTVEAHRGATNGKVMETFMKGLEDDLQKDLLCGQEPSWDSSDHPSPKTTSRDALEEPTICLPQGTHPQPINPAFRDPAPQTTAKSSPSRNKRGISSVWADDSDHCIDRKYPPVQSHSIGTLLSFLRGLSSSSQSSSSPQGQNSSSISRAADSTTPSEGSHTPGTMKSLFHYKHATINSEETVTLRLLQLPQESCQYQGENRQHVLVFEKTSSPLQPPLPLSPPSDQSEDNTNIEVDQEHTEDIVPVKGMAHFKDRSDINANFFAQKENKGSSKRENAEREEETNLSSKHSTRDRRKKELTSKESKQWTETCKRSKSRSLKVTQEFESCTEGVTANNIREKQKSQERQKRKRSPAACTTPVKSVRSEKISKGKDKNQNTKNKRETSRRELSSCLNVSLSLDSRKENKEPKKAGTPRKKSDSNSINKITQRGKASEQTQNEGKEVGKSNKEKTQEKSDNSNKKNKGQKPNTEENRKHTKVEHKKSNHKSKRGTKETEEKVSRKRRPSDRGKSSLTSHKRNKIKAANEENVPLASSKATRDEKVKALFDMPSPLGYQKRKTPSKDHQVTTSHASCASRHRRDGTNSAPSPTRGATDKTPSITTNDPMKRIMHLQHGLKETPLQPSERNKSTVISRSSMTDNTSTTPPQREPSPPASTPTSPMSCSTMVKDLPQVEVVNDMAVFGMVRVKEDLPIFKLPPGPDAELSKRPAASRVKVESDKTTFGMVKVKKELSLFDLPPGSDAEIYKHPAATRVKVESDKATFGMVRVKEELPTFDLPPGPDTQFSKYPAASRVKVECDKATFGMIRVKEEHESLGASLPNGVTIKTEPLEYVDVSKTETFLEEEGDGSSVHSRNLKQLMKETQKMLGLNEEESVPELWDGRTHESLYNYLRSLFKKFKCTVWEESTSLNYNWEVNLRRLAVRIFLPSKLYAYTRNIHMHMVAQPSFPKFLDHLIHSKTIT